MSVTLSIGRDQASAEQYGRVLIARGEAAAQPHENAEYDNRLLLSQKQLDLVNGTLEILGKASLGENEVGDLRQKVLNHSLVYVRNKNYSSVRSIARGLFFTVLKVVAIAIVVLAVIAIANPALLAGLGGLGVLLASYSQIALPVLGAVIAVAGLINAALVHKHQDSVGAALFSLTGFDSLVNAIRDFQHRKRELADAARNETEALDNAEQQVDFFNNEDLFNSVMGVLREAWNALPEGNARRQEIDELLVKMTEIITLYDGPEEAQADELSVAEDGLDSGEAAPVEPDEGAEDPQGAEAV